MLPYERIKKIVEDFADANIIHPEEIVEKYGVSIATARRDLLEIEKLPHYKKVYGGAAKIVTRMSDYPINERRISHTKEKDRIGRYCASLIKPNELIFLDIGSTTECIARHIKEMNVTVITNSFIIYQELYNARPELIMLGGKVNRAEFSITGLSAVNELKNYNLSKCFISCSGVAVNEGISDYNQNEIDVKREAINQSKEKILVTDSSKFNYVAPRKLCDYKDLSLIVSDFAIGKENITQYEIDGCKLKLV